MKLLGTIHGDSRGLAGGLSSREGGVDVLVQVDVQVQPGSGSV